MSNTFTTIKRPRHILQLSATEKRQFLDSFDNVFSDVDGVVWNVKSKVPRAAESFAAIEAAGKSLTFITNNSVRKPDYCVESFKRINLQANVSQIWHPARTAVIYLRHIKFEGPIYVLAAEPFKDILREAGFEVIESPSEILEEDLKAILSKAYRTEHANAVLLDMDINMSWAKLLQAQCYLRRPECLFICGATDDLLPMGDGINLFGPGVFSRILIEDTHPKEPIVVGKPGKTLGDMLMLEYKTKPNRCLMIGDSITQDVGFGRNCGFQTLLVLSGLNSLEDLQVETENVPDYYADSIADIEQLLNDVNGNAAKAHV